MRTARCMSDGHWVGIRTHSESKRQDPVSFRPTQTIPNEAVQAFGTEIQPVPSLSSPRRVRRYSSQQLTVLLFLLFRQTVLGLGDFEFPVSQKSDETDSKVGPSKVEGEVFSLLFPSRPLCHVRMTAYASVYVMLTPKTKVGTSLECELERPMEDTPTHSLAV